MEKIARDGEVGKNGIKDTSWDCFQLRQKNSEHCIYCKSHLPKYHINAHSTQAGEHPYS